MEILELMSKAEGPILSCGHRATITGHECSPGYAIRNKTMSCLDEQHICYVCSAIYEVADMLILGETVLYFNQHKITNWCGTLKFRTLHTRESKHNFGCTRTDVWFVGPDGHHWHGVNIGDNDLLRCKRTKQVSPFMAKGVC